MEKKNVATKEKKERRIFAGYYKRYDGFSFFVVDVVPDLETGQEFVVCKRNYFKANEKRYFVLSREEFCAKVKKGSRTVLKYRRDINRGKISEETEETLRFNGYRTPIHHDKGYDAKPHRDCKSYLQYAKTICRYYKDDYLYCQHCKENKCFKVVRESSEFKHLYADLFFLHSCLKTTLSDYHKFFIERFYHRKSMRKYGEEHGLNRGSVEHIQKKFMDALAKALKERDEADGRIRIDTEPDNIIIDGDCF